MDLVCQHTYYQEQIQEFLKASTLILSQSTPQFCSPVLTDNLFSFGYCYQLGGDSILTSASITSSFIHFQSLVYAKLIIHFMVMENDSDILKTAATFHIHYSMQI